MGPSLLFIFLYAVRVSGFAFARRRIGITVLALLAMLFVPLGSAAAVGFSQTPPLTNINGPIDDQAGLLVDPADRQELQAAIDRFHQETGYKMVVVTVPAFEGESEQEWANATANAANMGNQEVLLAFAPSPNAGERGYYSVSLPPDLNDAFTPARQDAVVAEIQNILDATANNQSTWGVGLANVVGAFGSEIVAIQNPGQAAPPAPAGTPEPAATPGTPAPPAQDGNADNVFPGATPGQTVESNQNGGIPTWARVLMWILIPLALLAALVYGWGGYKRKRLERQRQENPLGL